MTTRAQKAGREALSRAQREVFRGNIQVGGNPENPGFYLALAVPSFKRKAISGSTAQFFVTRPFAS